MQMGQFSCSMGLEWTGVHTHVSKAITSSKGFHNKRMVHQHTFNSSALYIML
jgi:hypothetical protein